MAAKMTDKILAEAIYALRRCSFRYGKYVFLTACDTRSLVLGKIAQHYGAAGVVFAVGTAEQRRVVEKLGFTAFIYGQDDIAKSAIAFTGKRMFDLCFETSGTAQGYDAILSSAKRGSIVGIMVEPAKPYNFKVAAAIRGQIHFIGVQGSDEANAGRLSTDIALRKVLREVEEAAG
jgi:threonine dehydrogenase-like Zn-dependent dehydrogenase